MKHLLLFFVTLSLISVPVLTQEERFLVRTYTTNDGLPSDHVNDVYVDQAGIVWAATSHGVAIMRGSRFEDARLFARLSTFLFTYPMISMSEGVDPGVILFAGEQASAFRVYPAKRNRFVSEHLPELFASGIVFQCALETNDRVSFFGSRGQGLWVRESGVIGGGFSHTRQGEIISYRQFLDSETVTTLAEGPGGTVWVGTPRGLRLFNDGEIRSVPGRLAPLIRRGISALAVDALNTVWIGTNDGRVYADDGERLQLRWASRTGSSPVVSVVPLGGDSVWVVTERSGIVRITPSRDTHFTEEEGVPPGRILSARADAQSNLWLATDRGVAVISRRTWVAFPELAEIAPDGFSSALRSRSGDLWFGGTGILVRMRGTEARHWRAPGELGSREFLQLVEDGRGTVWALTRDGIASFTGTSFSFMPDTVMWDRSVIRIVASPTEGVYRKTLSGVDFTDGKVWRNLLTENESPYFSELEVDPDGTVYVRTRWLNSGPIRLRDGSVSTARGSLVLELLKDDTGRVFFLDGRKGIISPEDLHWEEGDSRYESGNIGRWSIISGLIMSDGRKLVTNSASWDDGSTPMIKEIGVADGGRSVPWEAAHCVMELSPGNALLLSAVGFHVYSLAHRAFIEDPFLSSVVLPALLDDADIRARWTRGGGIMNLEDHLVSALNGDLWFASRRGIGMIPGDRSDLRPLRPIVSVIRAGESTFTSGFLGRGSISARVPWEYSLGTIDGFAGDDRLQLRPGDTDLEVDIAVPASSRMGPLGVQYRLRGFDEDWSTMANGNVIRLNDIDQGEYVLSVRSVTMNSSASPELSLTVSVLLPFWKASWFHVMGAVSVVYILFLIYERRVSTLGREHARATQLAVQQKELSMAKDLQLGMLPEECPDIPGYGIAARSVPASEVGGDFYDFIEGSDEMGIALGDVSGHGITGAMVVGMARTSLRFASSRNAAPAGILRLTNARLKEDMSRNIFVAMFYGVLSPAKRRLRYICAGQPTPILVRDGEARHLPHGKGDRFPLGILRSVRYKESTVVLRKGDVLLFYTDGIVEAMNEHKEQFGFDRLMRALVQLHRADAESVVNGLLASLQSFTNRTTQDDDITLVVLTVKGGKRS